MIRKKPFTKNDIVRTMFQPLPVGETSNEGKVCVIPYRELSNEYWQPEYQLFRLEGGNGCKPFNYGNSCYGYFCVDGEQGCFLRKQIVGIGNDEVQRIGEEMERVWKSKEREKETEM